MTQGWEVKSHSLSFPVLTSLYPPESSSNDVKGGAQENMPSKTLR